MSTDRETTRIVQSWLEDGVTRLPDNVLDAVLDELPTTHQRRFTWWPARRPPLEMNTTTKLALGVAAATLVAIVGLSVMDDGNTGGPGLGDPTPSAMQSAPATAATSPLPAAQGTDLAPGLYALGPGYPVGITLDLSTGWTSCGEGPVERSICRFPTGDPPPAVGLGFLVVANVVADPCDETVLLDPPVGPSVDDLVTAISNLEGFDATAAEDVTVDGYEGKRFTVTATYDTETGDCGATWATADRVNGVGSGEINDIYVIDVDGERVMISIAYSSDVAPAEIGAAEEVISLIRLEP